MANTKRTNGAIPNVLSFFEAAELLGCEPSVVRRLIMETGEIAATRFTPGGRRLPDFDAEYLRDMDVVSDDGLITATIPAEDGATSTVQRWREIPAGFLRIERAELERYAALPRPAGARENPDPGNQILPRVLATTLQEDSILAKLAEHGIDAQAIPVPPAGKLSPVKQTVRKELRYSKVVMDKAWQRLRGQGRIKDA